MRSFVTRPVQRKAVTGAQAACKVMAPAQCSYFVLGKWAENIGIGSCSPNLCPLY